MSRPLHPDAGAGEQPVALVTGSAGGIGFETCLALARSGWQVVATVRAPSQVDGVHARARADGVELDVRRLDVTSDDQVDKCVREVAADHGRLDAVVNNAGIAHVGTLEQDSLDDLRHVLDVNLLGVARVTRAALPHLRRSRGRLVAVSSVAGAVGQPFNDAYCASKHALEGLYESLAPVAAALGVRVVVVQPGPVRTDLLAKALLHQAPAPDADADGDGSPYAPLLRRYLHAVAGAEVQDPAQVAAVVAGVLADPDPPLRVQTSPLAARLVGRKLADLDGRAVHRMTAAWVAPGRPEPA